MNIGAVMQWPYLHKLIPSKSIVDPWEARKQRRQNFINNPHIVAKYLHLRDTMFRDEIFEHFHQATEFSSSYRILVSL